MKRTTSRSAARPRRRSSSCVDCGAPTDNRRCRACHFKTLPPSPLREACHARGISMRDLARATDVSLDLVKRTAAGAPVTKWNTCHALSRETGIPAERFAKGLHHGQEEAPEDP